MPDVLPNGQRIAYYKFNADAGEKAYSSIILNNSLEDSNLDSINMDILNMYGRTVTSSDTKTSDTKTSDNVITRSSGIRCLVADINGSETGSTGYIKVEKILKEDSENLDNYIFAIIPSITNRTLSSSTTVAFPGTAYNSGNGYSSALTLDLSNNSSIPNGAIVDSVSVGSTISSSVMGVTHYLSTASLNGWLSPRSSLSQSSQFEIGTQYGVEVKQPWQFMYHQTAYSSTNMRSVSMRISYEYDLKDTNYEFFNAL